MKTRHPLTKLILPTLGMTTLAVTVLAVGGDRKNQDRDDRRSSLVQRRAQPQQRQAPVAPDMAPAGDPAGPPSFPDEFRTIDGVGNNLANPHWGTAGVPFRRLTPVTYGDGSGSTAGADRPNARTISNMLCNQTESLPNARGASAFLWQWGQFLDHDIDETPVAAPAEEFDILVPAGDQWFDPASTGAVTIPLDRSAYVMVNNVRQQLNNITAFIDGSMVYGADDSRALELRTLDGTGRLKTSTGDLLPFNINGFPNAPTANNPSLFLAGDIRANEQVGLTAMHTLFVREHNYWADRIDRTSGGNLSDEEIYQRARAMVIAEIQAITYREFLPLLLGDGALPSYAGYDPQVDAGIANIFATAAYRVGHTMLSSPMLRLDADLNEIPAGHLPLAEAFFSPGEIIDHGIDSLIRGLAAQRTQEIDGALVHDVRNFLFGPPGAGGFDLASLNIQRGRDHGLATYNQVRSAYGLTPATSFSDISPDPDVQSALAAAYDHVDQIDAWAGMLCEPHVDGAMVGETIHAVLADQFARLRDGDRFWYESYFNPHLTRLIELQTFSRIIQRNTEVTFAFGRNPFMAEDFCAADLTGDGTVNVMDLLRVLVEFGCTQDCTADVTSDGVVNIHDLLVVLIEWGEC